MAKSFDKRMTYLTAQLMKGTENTIKKAALVALQEAVLRTPVRTGRAIRSWLVGLGKVNTSRKKGIGTENIETNRNMGAAEALINGSNVIKRWKLMGQGNIYISNTAEYSGDLDRGTSRQAPNGMSAFAIQAARQVLRKARLLKDAR